MYYTILFKHRMVIIYSYLNIVNIFSRKKVIMVVPIYLYKSIRLYYITNITI